jgi:protocatechuate 3,4-dioxygenase beta subunit
MNSSNNSGSITGRILSETGQPVVNAVVMISGDSPSHQDIAALTDENGNYNFNDLVPGEYTILVNVEGQEKQTKNTIVKEGETTQLNFSVR